MTKRAIILGLVLTLLTVSVAAAWQFYDAFDPEAVCAGNPTREYSKVIIYNEMQESVNYRVFFAYLDEVTREYAGTDIFVGYLKPAEVEHEDVLAADGEDNYMIVVEFSDNVDWSDVGAYMSVNECR